ncbi:MAG: hypothetical protein PHW62_06780 [Candidatus Ratteibacteria bacterium]|nr:hypothetical protein [Candidatus Ratteibacteria bacterium]
MDKLLALSGFLKFSSAEKKKKPACERAAYSAHRLTPPPLNNSLFYVDNL